MRIGKKITRTQTSVERIVLCDMCGLDVYRNDKGNEKHDATIESTDGEIWSGEDDSREITYIDVCSECFHAKVVPAIEALGAKFRKRDVDDYGHVDKMHGERDGER